MPQVVAKREGVPEKIRQVGCEKPKRIANRSGRKALAYPAMSLRHPLATQ